MRHSTQGGFERDGAVTHISLYRRDGSQCARTTIDTKDILTVLSFSPRWRLHHGYARAGRTYLHRLLLQPPPDKVVDHANRNKLDNRRSNLRLATLTENARNRSTNKGKAARKGVRLDAQGRWAVDCRFTVATYEEACAIRDAWELAHHGDFASAHFLHTKAA